MNVGICTVIHGVSGRAVGDTVLFCVPLDPGRAGAGGTLTMTMKKRKVRKDLVSALIEVVVNRIQIA